MTIITMVASECLPVTATLPTHPAEACSAVTGEPSPSLAMANTKRLVGDALAQLPLRFEPCDQGRSERFLARTSVYSVSLTATEATLIGRAGAGAGRLGRGADLGLPRNAGSLDANEQLPGPRRDRAAPRMRRSTTDQSLTATVRMQLIGANAHARMVGEGAKATRTNDFISNDPKRWQTNVPTYARVKDEQIYRGIAVIYYGAGR